MTSPLNNPSGKAKGRKILSLKEMELLKGSDVIRQYPQLERWLKEAPLTWEWASSLPSDDQQFIDSILPRIMEQASNEWKAEGNAPAQDLGAGRVRCSLCNTPNRLIFYLVNRLNGNRRNVGGDCVKHFGFDLTATGKTMPQLIREAGELRRITELNSAIPGIHKLLDNWAGHLDEHPILIPDQLERPYLELGSKIRSIYNTFIASDKVSSEQAQRDSEAISELRDLLEQRQPLVSDMARFVQENSTNPFAAHREYVRWVERHDHGAATSISWLKEDGQITARTIHRIAEPRLMNILVPDLNKILSPVGLRISQVDDQKRGYVLVPEQHWKLPIRLFVQHGPLLLRCGEAIFGEPTDVLLESVLELTTMADTDSMYTVWGELIPLLHRRGLDVPHLADRYEDFDAYFPEVVLREKTSGNYILVSRLSSLVDEYKELAFKVGARTADQLAQNISNPQVARYTQAALRDLYTERKEQERRRR